MCFWSDSQLHCGVPVIICIRKHAAHRPAAIFYYYYFTLFLHLSSPETVAQQETEMVRPISHLPSLHTNPSRLHTYAPRQCLWWFISQEIYFFFFFLQNPVMLL